MSAQAWLIPSCVLQHAEQVYRFLAAVERCRNASWPALRQLSLYLTPTEGFRELGNDACFLHQADYSGRMGPLVIDIFERACWLCFSGAAPVFEQACAIAAATLQPPL